MTIQRETVGNTIIVKPAGKLDTLSSRDFEAAMLENCAQAQKIILDMSEVIYISSAGLRTVIQAYKRMKDQVNT